MKASTILAALIMATVAAHAADSVVTFQNNVFKLPDGRLDPSKLVTFDATFGALYGSGVRNGVDGTSSYVAQLFMVGPGGVETSVGATANFRAATTIQPGTWSGATRTLVGVAPGTPVNLVVKVWDNQFASYELAALAASIFGPSPGIGKSAVFSYTQPLAILQPSDTYMTGFQGFSVFQPDPIFPIPEPSFVALVTFGLGGLLWLRRR